MYFPSGLDLSQVNPYHASVFVDLTCHIAFPSLFHPLPPPLSPYPFFLLFLFLDLMTNE